MLKLFFSFQGRLSRRKFWRAYWRLFAVTGAVAIPGMILFMTGLTTTNGVVSRIMFWTGLAIVALAIAASCVAMVAMLVKRAHDLGQPGAWLLYGFAAPRLMFADGEPRDNRYGPAST